MQVLDTNLLQAFKICFDKKAEINGGSVSLWHLCLEISQDDTSKNIAIETNSYQNFLFILKHFIDTDKNSHKTWVSWEQFLEHLRSIGFEPPYEIIDPAKKVRELQEEGKLDLETYRKALQTLTDNTTKEFDNDVLLRTPAHEDNTWKDKIEERNRIVQRLEQMSRLKVEDREEDNYFKSMQTLLQDIENRMEEQKRIKAQKAREGFQQMLVETTGIDLRTHWRDVEQFLEQDSRFTAVEEEQVRKEMFDEFILELRNKHKEDKHLEPITPEQDARIQATLSRSRDPMEVVIDRFNVQMARRHLQSLEERKWLVDEPINFYFTLLEERDKRNCEQDSSRYPRRSYFMNSFFLNKLFFDEGYNYSGVRRWTSRKKIDIFSADKIFFPVNVGNMHWCLAVIYMHEKCVRYFDSMAGSGSQVKQTLMKYLKDEFKDKKNAEFNSTGWNHDSNLEIEHIPQQENGYDCGVFTCMFADYISENESLNFSQKDMLLFRKRIVLSILDCNVR